MSVFHVLFTCTFVLRTRVRAVYILIDIDDMRVASLYVAFITVFFRRV